LSDITDKEEIQKAVETSEKSNSEPTEKKETVKSEPKSFEELEKQQEKHRK